MRHTALLALVGVLGLAACTSTTLSDTPRPEALAALATSFEPCPLPSGYTWGTSCTVQSDTVTRLVTSNEKSYEFSIGMNPVALEAWFRNTPDARLNLLLEQRVYDFGTQTSSWVLRASVTGAQSPKQLLYNAPAPAGNPQYRYRVINTSLYTTNFQLVYRVMGPVQP